MFLSIHNNKEDNFTSWIDFEEIKYVRMGDHFYDFNLRKEKNWESWD